MTLTYWKYSEMTGTTRGSVGSRVKPGVLSGPFFFDNEGETSIPLTPVLPVPERVKGVDYTHFDPKLKAHGRSVSTDTDRCPTRTGP